MSTWSSRASPYNRAAGEGIEVAVDAAGTIVHCAGSPKGDEDKARNLVRAASRAGEAYLVFISVVGADRMPIISRVDRALFGYFGPAEDESRSARHRPCPRLPAAFQRPGHQYTGVVSQ